MTISTQGTVNLSALTVPDLYINVQPPPSVALNGVPADIIGIVGTANWGPKNSPTIVGNLSDATVAFGPVQNRKYDLNTAVAIAQLQGANNFRLVRVTDGTDAAATVVVQSTCLTLNAKYTGSRGNSLQATIGTGTAAGSYKVSLALPGVLPETFDNLAVGATGNGIWVAIANAINNGVSATRPASNLVTATAGAGTATPVSATLTLAGGTDGATTITSSVLLGVDTAPRTGMYALRGTGCALFMLADCDTAASWSTQLAFGLSEQMQAVGVSPASDTLANIGSTQTSDSPWLKVIFGDWVYWLDTVNNVVRLVSPQAFYCGLKASIGPHQSALNKQLLGVVGTQKSYANQVYSTADLTALAAARVDVVTNPCPGGSYFGFRFGRNTCSDAPRRQDSYTTLTDYIAVTLNAGAGKFVGQLLTPDEMREAQNTIGGFLQTMWEAGQIGSADGSVPYSVTISAGAPGTGTQKAVVMVRYYDVIEFFVVDLTGGASVVIQSAVAA